jgi:translation initiation factor IF-1
MVKNQFGGSRAKGLARKNERGDQNRRLRLSECEFEKYAIVRKICGGDGCEVICDDNVIRHAIIRGKFTGGKGKRQNMISSSTLVLVGLREWASSNTGKKEKCDILEVYGALEIDQLKMHPKFPVDFMVNALRDTFGDSAKESAIDEFIFTSTVNDNVEEIDNVHIKDKAAQFVVDNGEIISIDDI